MFGLIYCSPGRVLGPNIRLAFQMPDVTLVVMYLRNLPFLRSSTQSTPFCSCDHTTTRARGATVTRRLPAVKMADRLLRLSPCTWREFARVENIRCRGVGRCFDLGGGELLKIIAVSDCESNDRFDFSLRYAKVKREWTCEFSRLRDRHAG